MTELIGQTLGNYQIEALLGASPAGPRYAARHTRLQRQAALRVFAAGLAGDPDGRRRLLASLRTASGLRHPRIAEIFDVGEQGGQLFAASELVAGGPLRALLQRQRQEQARLPLATAVGLARQAAEGVGHAHARGIVHGAVSPVSLRLVGAPAGDATPELKVDDFGLAAVLPEEAAATPAYLTPEQCRGLPLTARSDVYALGVLLFELLVGVPPFNVADTAQAAEKHLRARPVPPRMVRPQIPTALEAVVLRCLAKAPEDRFATAGELAEALGELGALLPGERVTAPLPAVAPVAPAPPVAPLPVPVPPLPPMPDDDPLLNSLLDTGAPAAPPAEVPAEAPTVAFTPPGGQLALQLDQAQLALTPGRPNFVNVRLANQGQSTDSFLLSVDGVPGDWLRDNELPVRVGPGQTAVVPLVVEPPAGGRGEAGDYNVLIRARSASDQFVAGSAPMRWTVLPVSGASLSIAPDWAEGRTEADFALTVRNEGNEAAAFTLSADDRSRLLAYEWGGERVSLGPGQAARVHLTVEAPRKLFGDADEIPFVVFATPDSGEAVAAEATFVRRPALPTWLPLLLATLVLGLLVLGLVLSQRPGQVADATPTPPAPPTEVPTPQPGAPVVAFFTANPPTVAPGQPVILQWDVRGAERVRIDQLGDVPPLGQGEFRPEQTTDFRLVALAGGLETTSIQRVIVAPPTAEPTLLPTLPPVEPPTLVPPIVPTPEPTAPPTVEAVPPTIEAVPPTVEAVPPIAEITPEAPVAGPLNLLDLAPTARWRNSTGRITFGRPAEEPEAGGWADVAADVVLEDGSSAGVSLLTLPEPQAVSRLFLPGPTPSIEGRYQLPEIQPGQFFLADVGFAQGAAGPGATVLVSFDNEPLFEQEIAPDGQLTRISADLAPFVGREGQLSLRVTRPNGPSPDGVYWVQPRVDLPS